ncbi:helix-turn-helix domain-containing protein [Fructilactobacillus florum]|uniref:HTH cro/C1-type domain-containing protein n=1 Tax=Fructilactobacillus florum DSM 22689 = JCM 16035 TaxID=1423745 RepID=A0A0R2CJP3_9LACO|nr:hypothetical protein FC87_GL000696 [Fructilactobacillus florum DSM 22689 = JCM 16035]
MTMSKIDEYIAKRSEKSPEFKKVVEQEKLATQAAYEVHKLRTKLGLSQRDFATLVGKPQSTISRIETGEMNPSFQLLNEIGEKTNSTLEFKYVSSN